ncbi:MAG: UbiX family flavin prenyltransferase [Desulfonatronovibrionaceae bacterium]
MNSIVLALTGASGMVYGLELIRQMVTRDILTQVIVSRAAYKVLALESPGYTEVLNLAHKIYTQDDTAAPPASGSYPNEAMVVCPCSMASLGAIANGLGSNLIHRAADVTLKERRPLILVPRETPLNRVHLENLLKAHDSGAVILPPCPGFYHSPDSLKDLVNHIVGRILDVLAIENNLYPRWQEH